MTLLKVAKLIYRWKVVFSISFLCLVIYAWHTLGSSLSLRTSASPATWFRFDSKLSQSGPFAPRTNYSEDYQVALRERHFDNFFFKVDIEVEHRHSVLGGPLDYLPNFKNPCWYSTLWPSHVTKVKDAPGKDGVRRVRLRCLPYVILAGVSKSGSTDLFFKMLKHADVAGPMYKEPGFWNRRRVGVLTVPRRHVATMTLSQYVDNFDQAALQIEKNKIEEAGTTTHPRITVDGTPFYLWDYEGWKKIPANRGHSEPQVTLAHSIRRLIQHGKIIVILRNPTDRLYSQFRQFSAQEHPAVFHCWVKDAVRRFRECVHRMGVRSCTYNASINPHEWTQPGGVTLRAGLYHVFLKDWLDVYPRDQVLILLSDEYYRDRNPVLGRVFRFLGLRDMTADEYNAINSKGVMNSKQSYNRSEAPMMKETRHLLDQFYAPFNDKLSQLLEDKRFTWT